MSANHKLTALLKGRVVNETGNADGRMTISFTDGSKMTVKTAGSTNSGATGGTVKAVRQQGTELNLDLEEGGTLTIPTAEASSCVMVRHKSGALEYAD
jgi:hypothetical protein